MDALGAERVDTCRALTSAEMRARLCAVRGMSIEWYLSGKRMVTNLVLGTLGIEHGDEHVSVAIAFCAIGVKNLAETRWRGLLTVSGCVCNTGNASTLTCWMDCQAAASRESMAGSGRGTGGGEGRVFMGARQRG